MRRLLIAAAAALSLVATSSMVAGRAQAMPLPGAGDLAAASKSDLVENVRTVCQTVFNGYRWVRSCYWVPGPRVYGYGYYGPRYYGYRRW